MDLSALSSTESAVAHLNQFGYVVIDAGVKHEELSQLFTDRYLTKFTADAEKNRNLLKIFANDISLRTVILSEQVLLFLQHLQSYPVMTGPVVTHWTSTDHTGGHYALPYHQDWPSMGTSSKSVICWITLHDVDDSTHGISVIPGSHKYGVAKGAQTENGYLVEVPDERSGVRLHVRAGQALFMSAWLIHKTHLHPGCADTDYKLSLSLRFDDLEDDFWSRRGFVSAYQTTVDRSIWKQ